MKIKDQNMALQLCNDAGNNQALLSSRLQQELLKILIVDTNGQAPSSKSLEDLDECFEYSEYLELSQAMAKVMGGGDQGKFQTETSFIGNG